MQVRTRFAPSPTGYLHIGGLRTALYAYLLARKNKGAFILRIEDTDLKRQVEGAEQLIYDTLKGAGLNYDEGPDVGGPYGPYIQSQRMKTYRPYAEQLIEQGKAYYCFCTTERLQTLRESAEQSGQVFKYDKCCANLDPDDALSRVRSGEPHVIRQNIPQTGTTSFDDAVFGHIEVELDTLDDMVLIKSDGMPTYNFANVVDDHLMGITHIMRGTEFLSSTPKFQLLYEALGWEAPVYVHMPPVMKDAHRKLSKRDGDASYQDFIDKGYLSEAIVNYIALLGWSSGTNQEKFTLSELAEAFDISGINKSPAIFDVEKLTWLNAQYIRELPKEEFLRMAKPYLTAIPDTCDLDLLAEVLQPRVEVLTTIPEQVEFIADLPEDYDTALYIHKKMKTTPELALNALQQAYACMEKLTDWTTAALHDALMALAAEMGIKNGQLLYPLRIALTGRSVTPGGATEAAVLIGKAEALRRIGIGIGKLSDN